ncbi:GAF domain-containing protein [Nesterenkonia sp. AN1]|uniref:GAF domain-containing protein n=1 Tax=Nesterenkonia sp. AN1 TaxID=652017 RepID=UPI0004B6CC5F|nr:GAF domain-containing protein [Nesterenkonia sp. AN1]
MSTESKLSDHILETDTQTVDDAVLDAIDTDAAGLDASADLQVLLEQDTDISSFLQGLAQVSAERFSGTQPVLCSIILDRSKRNVVVAASSPEAARLDEVQAGFDEGPCLEAQRTNTVISVSDVRSERRWPGYMAAVREFGMRSVLALPLTLQSESAAAMNLYTSTPEPSARPRSRRPAATRSSPPRSA